MKIKRNCTFLSKEINFFLIRIVLCLFTCLNTSYAMSDNALVPYQQLAGPEPEPGYDYNSLVPYQQLAGPEPEPGYDYNSLTKAFIKAVRTSSCSRESIDFIKKTKSISLAVEDRHYISNEYLSESLKLLVLADVLYGLTFLPLRVTKHHIYRNIVRSFALGIFLAAVGDAIQSEGKSFGVYTITKEMNAMNKEFNDQSNDLKPFLLEKTSLLDIVLRSTYTSPGPDLTLKSTIIQEYGAVFLAVGYLSFVSIVTRMILSSVVVTRIIKLPHTSSVFRTIKLPQLPPNYDSVILFSEVMILLGSHIYAASLPFIRKQNFESGIIFIDWLKNFRRGSAIIVLDDILNSPKVQDLLKSSKLNMSRNSSEYNIVLEEFLKKMYKEYNSIRLYGEIQTNLLRDR